MKFDPEAAALTRSRLQAHSATHALDDFADEGKADAGAFVIFAEALEHLPNFIVIFGGDADAVIGDGEPDPLGSCELRVES